MKTLNKLIIILIAMFFMVSSCFAEPIHKKVQSLHQPPVVQPATQPNLAMSIEQRIVAFVHETVDTLRYSAYKLGGNHFDKKRGVYILDCSDYVDHVLRIVYPKAYFNLVRSTGADKPTSVHYFDFFNGLSEDEPNHYWNKIDSAIKLQPGDILVFRNKETEEAGGHVMVIMGKPKRTSNSVSVRVADSAPVGHSHDTRSRHTSGIGIGTMLLKINPRTGEPYAYAWKIGSNWNRDVNFAMGRPIDKNLKKLLS